MFYYDTSIHYSPDKKKTPGKKYPNSFRLEFRCSASHNAQHELKGRERMGVPGGGVCSSQADQRKPQHLAGPRHHPSEREGETRQTDNARAYEELTREGCKLQRTEGECRLLCIDDNRKRAPAQAFVWAVFFTISLEISVFYFSLSPFYFFIFVYISYMFSS